MSDRILTTVALVETIAAGIRVLRTRDGIAIDEAHVMERARNIAQAVLGLIEEGNEP
jgi:hypothetical protein